MQDPPKKSADTRNTDKQIDNSASNDVWIHRLTTGGFTATIVTTILAAAMLQAVGKEPPQMLTFLGFGALQGLNRLQSETTTRRIRGSS